MRVGILKRILKNTITKRVFWIKSKQRNKNKEQRHLRCSQTNQWPHFSEDLQCLPMEKCSYYPVEFGEAVPPKTLSVVHIYSGRIIILNPPSQSKPVNNLFWYVNSVPFFLKSPILKRDSSNNLITWFLLLPLPTASFFITPSL